MACDEGEDTSRADQCPRHQIVAEIGKLMIEEIPLEQTRPGMPRAEYYGASKTDQLLQEATRSLADVGFAPAGASGGMHRQDASMLRGSEWDDSGQDYMLSEGAQDGPYPGYAGYAEQQDASQPVHPDRSQPVHPDEADQTTPIYATHSVMNRARGDSVNAEPGIVSHDTATDEWKRTKLDTRAEGDHYGPHSSTPIADQFASRSPEDVQVGGSGLRMVGGNYDSTDSLGRDASALPPSIAAPNGPAPPRISTPPPLDGNYHTPDDGYGAHSAPPVVASPSVSTPQDDASYFQSVGSTRAAQQAVRRPTSPSSSVNASQSFAGSLSQPGGMPASPYEPQAEGRKMTAAAFRKGFARAPSSQQMGTSASGPGTTPGGSNENGYGQEDPNATAPLAIRKRLSAVPGQTFAAGDDHPAPPYDSARHQSVYGGYEEYPSQGYAEAPVASTHPVPGQFYAHSFNGSRPGSAAGWRTPNSHAG